MKKRYRKIKKSFKLEHGVLEVPGGFIIRFKSGVITKHHANYLMKTLSPFMNCDWLASKRCEIFITQLNGGPEYFAYTNNPFNHREALVMTKDAIYEKHYMNTFYGMDIHPRILNMLRFGRGIRDD